MYYSVLALLLRSLRVDVRSRGAHLTRLALCVALYFAVIQFHIMAMFKGAPGLDYFRWVLWLNMTFITLVGLGIFSSPIAEEKEEDSLGLLKMAGVDSLGLLLGKVGGRLMQAVALLVVQFPFTLLSITMGGVMLSQIRAAYMALAAFVIMMAGIGVLCSTICQSTRSASALLVFILAVYALVPYSCSWGLWGMTLTGSTSLYESTMRLAMEFSVFLQIGGILSTGYSDSWWTIQVVSNSLLGLVCFLLAWALFDVCTRNPRTEPVSRGLATRGGFRFAKPGRAYSNALIWKDFHFATGGFVGLGLRLLCYIGLFAVIFYLNQSNGLQSSIMIFLGCQLFVLPLDASLLISRALQDEVRGQTISSLVMLPRSVPFIVYSKLAGALLGLLPGLLCFLVALGCSDVIRELMTADNWFQVPLTMIYGIFYILLLPHLTAVIALVVRWGATPLAIAALYAVQMVEGMLMLPLIIFSGGMGAPPNMALYFGLQILMNLALCVACHYELLRRFRKLAEA